MREGFKLPSWSARNPLGIIALFISLIYGMSALLLGVSVDSLEPHNETILVVFIVVFPVVVLGVFSWLVAMHHKKLYGPRDYQTDQGFIEANNAKNPASLGQRLENEIDEDIPVDGDGSSAVSGVSDVQVDGHAESSGKQTFQVNREAFLKYRENVMMRTYLAESLVFQDLQNELGGAIRREVAVRTKSGRKLNVDGLVEHDAGTTIVEVKRANNQFNALRVLHEIPYRMRLIVDAVRAEGAQNVNFLLIIVLDAEEKEVGYVEKRIERFREDFGNSIEIRVYQYQNLLKRYGFPLTDALTSKFQNFEPPGTMK